MMATNFMSNIRSILYTAYLFNEKDIISTVLPTVLVGMVLVGPTDLRSFLLGLAWQELHLLCFEIQNQIIGLEEDKLSKPHRPIASGRLSVATAQPIYMALTTLSLLFSYYLGIMEPSLLHLVSMVAYNEMKLAKFWYLKSFIGSMGYVCYCWGVTRIFDNALPLSQVSIIAVIVSCMIFTTTGHVQDYRDIIGDAAIGRKTLVMILPQAFGRWSLMFLVFGWTLGLIRLWNVPALFSVVFATPAVLSMVSLVTDYSQKADSDSYWWYNIWLLFAHILPVFSRVDLGQNIGAAPQEVLANITAHWAHI